MFRVEGKDCKLNEQIRNVHSYTTQDKMDKAKLEMKPYMKTYRQIFPHSIKYAASHY